MSSASNRVFVAQVVFLTVTVVAVWYLAIRPMKASLMSARAEYAAQQKDIKAFHQAQQTLPESGSQALARMKSERQAISERLRLSGNSSLVYDKFRSLAAEYDVDIERIEPVRTRAGRGKSDSVGVAIESTGHTIEFSGSFDDVAAFVQAVQDRVGMSKVTTLRMTPARVVSDDPMIDAQIEAVHFRLTGELGAAEERTP